MPQQCEWDISVEDLKKLRDDGAEFVLIDVREQKEVDICEIGGDLIPLQTLPQRLAELDKGAHTVVHCRSGARSANAVNLMRQFGFTNAWNVNGGILAWIDRIDSSLTRY
jgi:adenylyltransferase/sulfurtransferase